MRIKDRFSNILSWFANNAPSADTELIYDSPFQLLVAVVLSAQCTDRRVNLVTPNLFAAYPDAESMSQASVADIFLLIHSVSYPNVKAEHLVGLSRRLVEFYNGQIPDSLSELMTLPGVGRKTANVICAVIYNQPTMAVDTHIFRVSERLGLTTNSKNPLQTELQLTKYIPAQMIPKTHHWLLLHGRYVCVARTPHCEKCGLTSWCRTFQQKTKRQV